MHIYTVPWSIQPHHSERKYASRAISVHSIIVLWKLSLKLQCWTLSIHYLYFAISTCNCHSLWVCWGGGCCGYLQLPLSLGVVWLLWYLQLPLSLGVVWGSWSVCGQTIWCRCTCPQTQSLLDEPYCRNKSRLWIQWMIMFYRYLYKIYIVWFM